MKYELTSDILLGTVPDHIRTDMLAENFWRYVDVSMYEIKRMDEEGDGGKCWAWTGKCAYGKNSHDRKYGQVTSLGVHPGAKRKWHYAHRVSYVIHHGDLAAGQVVRHMCGNPNCVNPWHLRGGTHTDNRRDEGLARRFDRETSERIVREIRFFCGKGVKQAHFVRKYGLSRSTVSSIARGLAW